MPVPLHFNQASPLSHQNLSRFSHPCLTGPSGGGKASGDGSIDLRDLKAQLKQQADALKALQSQLKATGNRRSDPPVRAKRDDQQKRDNSHSDTLDFKSKPGFIGLDGKFYKRGLLQTLLKNHFGYTWAEASKACWHVILSPSSDPKIRQEACPDERRAGHQSPTEASHKWQRRDQRARLLKLHEENFSETYKSKAPQDFRGPGQH